MNLRRQGYGALTDLKDLEIIPELIRFSEQAWETYAVSILGCNVGKDPLAADVLGSLVYHGQNCSYSIGLLTTWAQPLEALALLRIRFEQLLTSSYLVHAPRVEGLERFRRSVHRMDLNVLRKMKIGHAPMYDFLEKILGEKMKQAEAEAETWERMANPDYKSGQRVEQNWTNKDNLTLARERDKLAKGKHFISNISLEDCYQGFYRHASGIVHVDANLLTSNYVAYSGPLNLPMPNLVQLFLNLLLCAHFDIVQTYEVCSFFGTCATGEFEKLFTEFSSTVAEFFGPDFLVELFKDEEDG